jgi:hypothetical protein
VKGESRDSPMLLPATNRRDIDHHSDHDYLQAGSFSLANEPLFEKRPRYGPRARLVCQRRADRCCCCCAATWTSSLRCVRVPEAQVQRSEGVSTPSHRDDLCGLHLSRPWRVWHLLLDPFDHRPTETVFRRPCILVHAYTKTPCRTRTTALKRTHSAVAFSWSCSSHASPQSTRRRSNRAPRFVFPVAKF